MNLLTTIYHAVMAIAVLALLFVLVFGILFVLIQGVVDFFWSVDLLAWLSEQLGVDLKQWLPFD